MGALEHTGLGDGDEVPMLQKPKNRPLFSPPTTNPSVPASLRYIISGHGGELPVVPSKSNRERDCGEEPTATGGRRSDYASSGKLSLARLPRRRSAAAS